MARLKLIDRKRLLYQISAVRAAGDQMSNICFNLAQQDKYPADLRKTFDQCRRNWDASVRMLDTTKL